MSVWMCVCQHRLSECSQVTIPSRGWACWSGNGVLEHRTADTAHWLVHPTCLHKLFNLESMRMCSIMTTSAGRYCKNPTSNGSTASRTALTTCHFLFFFLPFPGTNVKLHEQRFEHLKDIPFLLTRKRSGTFPREAWRQCFQDYLRRKQPCKNREERIVWKDTSDSHQLT